jgi:hypothetical protein
LLNCRKEILTSPDQIQKKRRLGENMQVVSRRYRAGIYGLLGMVLACGLGLSILMGYTAADIRKTAMPLLQDKVPDVALSRRF